MALSFKVDRPVAIRGLEKRLIRTLETVGGYGVFDCFLHRCLLWQRSGDTLARISFSKYRYRSIPSWSWMAFDGGIRYMDVPGGEVSWAKDIPSPFKAGNVETGIEGQPHLEIEAPVFDIVEGEARGLIFDEPSRRLVGPTKCVIIGSNDEMKVNENGLNYILIVTSTNEDAMGVYERVGVGVLENRQIVLDQPGATVRIR